MILAGTTVAGGLGIGAWSVFGPGPSDGASNPALQLFASKPKDASAIVTGVAPVAADGSSQSLSFLAKANAPSGEATVQAPPADASAPVTDGATAASNANSATPNMGESMATNGAAPKVSLQGAKKLGELSKSFGGGGSGGSASASAAPPTLRARPCPTPPAPKARWAAPWPAALRRSLSAAASAAHAPARLRARR